MDKIVVKAKRGVWEEAGRMGEMRDISNNINNKNKLKKILPSRSIDLKLMVLVH